MRAVLGIDAAWTPARPSGVALAVEEPGGWRLVAAESCYAGFLARAAGAPAPAARPAGTAPEAPALLAAAVALAGRRVDLVAVDMPLARSPITGRRASDNAVSRAYGARKCGTHTPSAARPGRLADGLRAGFEAAGYLLRTASATPREVIPGLIEVYPHPALVELAGAPRRLPYKAARAARYWPDASPAERKARLLEQWAEIGTLLDAEIAGFKAALPRPALDAPGWVLKAHEDALDAVVCAWVAICVLEGRAQPFGDADSAIWIPRGEPAQRT
jgi:predicted RNase H-like nuclease